MAIENTFGNINFNGVDLSQNNIFVQHYPLMGAPSRRQTAISGVAHRNAVFDEKEYDNVDVELDFVIVADTFEELSDRRAFLFRTLDVGGYVPVKIEPDPFVYYMYRTSDMKETLFDGNPLNWIRVITVTFSRDPFKYEDVNIDRNYILDTANPKTQTSNGKDNQDIYNQAIFYSPIKNWGVANGDYIISFDWTLKTALSSDMQASVFFNQSPWQQQNFTVKSGQLTGHVDLKFKLNPGILTATQDVTSFTFRIMSQMASGNTITYSNLFMKSGTSGTWTPAPEDGITITESGTTILNPYNYDSLPLVKIYANTGTAITNVNINGVIQLKNVSDNIVLDTLLEDAYWVDSTGKYVNGNASMLKPYFPRLQPQLNAITFDSTVSKIVITPRWRTL